MPHRGKSKNKPSRAWTWTLNNYADSDESSIRLWDVRRSIFGHENEGTPHLQGFTVFKTPRRLSALKKLLPRAHWEPAVCPDAAWDYCTKGADIFSVDNRLGQGCRTDLELLVEDIKGGASDYDLLTNHTACFFKYPRGIASARAACAPPRRTWTLCEWHVGPTRSGKSSAVSTTYPDADWIHITKSGFFFGHTGARVAILDDPDLSAIPRELFLALINHVPMRIPVKGGDRVWNAERLVIVSNFSPENFFPLDQAIQGRIHIVYEYHPNSPCFRSKDIIG